jgi:putative nucleotidyltransferase with HDIG domain
MSSANGTAKATHPPAACWSPESIPPFPAVALKALKMMARTDTSLFELCNLIRSDPAFSTAVLGIANSPLVAFPKNVTSVVQASMLLGFGRLRSVAITIGLKAYLRDCYTPLMGVCWRHSVATAIIAERSAKSRYLDHEFAYTAGILHDIGRVAMAMVMPAAYLRVLEHEVDQPRDVLSIESEVCGIDHCAAGRSLVSAWSLPEAFLDIVACHHEPPRTTGTAALIPASCALADALGFGVIRSRLPRCYGEILAEFPEPGRTQFPTQAEPFASEIRKEIHMIESA